MRSVVIDPTAGRHATETAQSWWKHPILFLRQTEPAHKGSSATGALTGAFASLAELVVDIASEGQRTFTASLQFARHAKAAAACLLQQVGTMEDLQRVNTEVEEATAGSRGQIAEAQTLIGELGQIASGRTHLIDELVESIRQNQENLRTLNTRFSEVESFVAVIREIGDQTSILALNAAIEASRAGSHGAGFNVVAREMRTLADRTEAATREILGITQGMRQSSDASSASMHAADGWSQENYQIGQRATDAVERCRTTLQHAEAAASRAVRGIQSQHQVMQRFSEECRTIHESTILCGFHADAYTENSMGAMLQTVPLARGLEQLGARVRAEIASPEQQGNFDASRKLLQECAAECGDQADLAAFKQLRPHILQSLDELVLACMRLGPASRREAPNTQIPELCFGASAMNLNHMQIDELSRSTGLFISLFVLTSERKPEFYRIATSIQRMDGQRAVGTQLNSQSAAARKLLKGESVYGYVYISGVSYLCGYAPICDAAGQVIGAACAGSSSRIANTPFREGSKPGLEFINDSEELEWR